MEDEEEALARALELSRIEQQTNQAASSIPHDDKDRSFLPGQLAHGDLVTVNEYNDCFRFKTVPNVT